MPVPVTLKIYKGSTLLGTKEFQRDIIKIGRLSSAHLSLEDEKISRIHAVIEVSADGNLSVIDMGSVEGTFVNGKRVNKGAVVSGDEITLGGTKLVVELGGAKAEARIAAESSGLYTPAPVVAPSSAPAPRRTMAFQTFTDLPAAQAAAPVLAPSPAPIAAPPVISAPVVVPAPVPAMPPTATPAPPAMLHPSVPHSGEAPEPAPTHRRTRTGKKLNVALSHKGTKTSVHAVADGEEGVEVRVFWDQTLLSSAFRPLGTPIVVGASRRADVAVSGEEVPGGDLTIVRSDPKTKEIEVRFPRSSEGELAVGDAAPVRLSTLLSQGKAHPLSSPPDCAEFALPPDALVWFGLGALRLEVERKRNPKRVVVPFWADVDFRFINITLLIAFAMLAFIISAATLPLDTDTTQDDLFRNPHAMAKFVVKPPEKTRSAYVEKLEGKAKEKGETSARHADNEGKMGKKTALAAKTKSAPKAIDVNAKEVVKNSGLIKLLGSGSASGLSTIFGHGGLGGDLKGAIGNMFGPAVGDAQGLGGLGLRGTGVGGGGVGNTIGIGDIGTKGRGGGLAGYGHGLGNLGRKSGSDVAISSGNPVVEGSMDKELIRRVIHSHANQVRFCYESELQRHPGLNGKVTVKFVIQSNGTVSHAGVDSSSLGNANVEGCIVSRVYQWQFPKPKGGGIVQVNYPFLLKESGD
jgi:pSer/pThr/pTyr-binding forkhead associated (FHA) protein